MVRRPFLLALAFLTLFLSGCPAVSEPPDRTIRQLGVVSVGTLYNDEGSYEVYGAAGLFMPVERSLASLERVTDHCFVNEVPPLFEDEVFATLLDAGEFIDLRTGGQPFMPLGRVNFMGGGYGYTAGEFIAPIPFPERVLTADVPGAAFPAFADAEFPAPPPPVEFTNGEPMVTLTLEGSFTWLPYQPENGVSLIEFQVVPPDLETGPYFIVSCVTADDGEFSFPAGTREALLRIDDDLEGVVYRPDRSAYRLEIQGDAALALSLGDDATEVLLRQ